MYVCINLTWPVPITSLRCDPLNNLSIVFAATPGGESPSEEDGLRPSGPLQDSPRVEDSLPGKYSFQPFWISSQIKRNFGFN